ncbi:MAG TPA: cytidine deaminase [Candidatus Avacidaminococcus intestinavium]|uniref:Cytidine deaminase n=1 Tax=Candidatus Avacidaminococcus intestinavium TaxID=2840684 RepID=A0A9D1MPG6_9FIRM|nr:cytidine deaminase [Candidatus Avacidaminococcus intestinavium]
MDKELYVAALAARENAYAPYSNFKVGAALKTTEGRIFCGANIENGSYGLTSCAERNAIFNAVSSGCTKFATLCVVADTAQPVRPCGACLQVMAEFKIQEIIMTNCQGESKRVLLSELLPYGFQLSNKNEE